MGLWDLSVDTVPPEDRKGYLGILTGVNGGHDLDARCLAAKGVALLGHLRGVEDGTCTFASDLEQTLIRADETCDRLLSSVDEYIQKNGIDAPEPDTPSPSHAIPASLTRLNFGINGISSVVWATGFRDDFGWVHLPVFDDRGKPVHRRGVTRQPGIYFLGLSWLHAWKSASVIGVGDDAAYLAEHITARP